MAVSKQDHLKALRKELGEVRANHATAQGAKIRAEEDGDAGKAKAAQRLMNIADSEVTRLKGAIQRVEQEKD